MGRSMAKEDGKRASERPVNYIRLREGTDCKGSSPS